MDHATVVARGADGEIHYFRIPGPSTQAKEKLLALLQQGAKITDEFGRVYGAWEIEAASLELAVPDSDSSYPPFAVDGRRIKSTRGTR